MKTLKAFIIVPRCPFGKKEYINNQRRTELIRYCADTNGPACEFFKGYNRIDGQPLTINCAKEDECQSSK